MNQFIALAWKEWRESRVYLWIGLGIFIGLPAVAEFEAIFHTNHRFEFQAFPLVIGLGGVMAVIVSVGSSCRDLHGHIEDFWRSRPVGVLRWWLVKYLVGLAIVAAMCVTPIAVELCFKWRDWDHTAIAMLAWYPTFWAAVYSIGFLAGCVVRRTAHAATLALAGLLLLYLAPVIFPPLAWLNAADIPATGWPTPYDDSLLSKQQVFFAGGMACLAILGLALAILAIRLDWHMQSGRKMMYGLVAAALLLLFASAAFQLGTNMPVLQQIRLPSDEVIRRVDCDGTQGHLLVNRGDSGAGIFRLRSFQIDARGISGLTNSVSISGKQWNFLENPLLKVRQDIAYSAYYFDDSSRPSVSIVRLAIGDPRDGTHLHEMTLWQGRQPVAGRYPLMLFAWKDHLYVMATDALITLDITDENVPKVIFTAPFKFRWDMSGFQHEYTLTLPVVPGVPPIERLRAALVDGFDGETTCVNAGEWVASYRLSKLTAVKATFTETGRYVPSLLQTLVCRSGGSGEMILNHGLLYTTQRGIGAFGNSISVFDTRGPHPMRMIGHFAAPGLQSVCPLDDGRAIAVGDRTIWLIGPPPGQPGK